MAVTESSADDLVQAVIDGRFEDVRYLVSDDNINKYYEVYGRYGTTALGAACRSGHVGIVQFLLSSGADVSVKSDESTPLHVACDEGHLDIVKLLLQRGANIEDTDWYQRTALHRACDSGHNAVVVTLLEHGANVGTLDDEEWTPLHICRSGQVALTLLEHGANVNARDDQGLSPLARMSICDDINRVSALLDYGGGTGIICGLLHSKFDGPCTKTVLMCCYTSFHKDLFRKWIPSFEMHFIKWKLAGKRLHETEKPVDPPEAGVDWSLAERDAYAKLCLEELHKMKTDTIGNTGASYFSLLTRDHSGLRGHRLLDAIQWKDCHSKYPIYGNMIRCSYLSLRRFFLKEQSLAFFSLATNRMLPECAEIVLGFLPDKDLETLALLIV